MTAAPRALKFVPRWIAQIVATFSLSLLAACSSLDFKLPSFLRDQASAAPPRVVGGGPPLQWGDRIDGTVVADPTYVIGPEDALEISVWRDETLKGAALVRPDGGISFPLAGDMIVAGKTATQVREELVRRLEKFIPEPVVTVSVVRVSSYRFYVLGRVNKPGDFQTGRNIDVLQALSMAGGMTPFANEDEIRIIRKVGGQSVSIPFQYSRFRKGGDLSQNITLKSGDVLLVP
jgi:polysaccharide biosynthesis/export protein